MIPLYKITISTQDYAQAYNDVNLALKDSTKEYS